ncbi:MAG: hypothetical protein AAGJ08_04475 [Cyanobacteria bacterium P01_H01_bin.35]
MFHRTSLLWFMDSKICRVPEGTGEIVTAIVSTNDVSDDEAFSELLNSLE